ncbi:MAG TPA: hypothetical protein ENI07_06215 [Desulfobacterales bacterium]|nr:hypothetical protein [Desulfobacterales bacterium]
MTVWTETWPEGDGDWYWFYGSPHGEKENVLMPVRVWKKTHGGFIYRADEVFIVPGVAKGVWVPMTLPEVPEEK